MLGSTHDHLTRLSFSIYENKGVYALLIGSGVSRAAGIPTGWEITVDLIRRIAVAQGEDQQPDWAVWYRETAGKEPDYSELIAELGLSPEERRSILQSYIEPTEDDREEGRKVPTAAHHAIADLVHAEHVRVLVTTNFDRLLENALRERGVEPTVVPSVDAFQGAESLTHTRCYLLKLHGDYKDARILNTDTELTSYPPEFDALLDRILDEHGLVVCGWSGEWDHALRRAILRSPTRRYSMFWAAQGQPSDRATELIAHRKGHLVPIDDADAFFSGVRDRVKTLALSHQQNPGSIDLLVNGTKRFLAKPEYRIQLDELFTSEARSLLNRLEAAESSGQATLNAEEFRRRVAICDATVEPLARMVGVLGRWGDGSELALLMDIVRSIHHRAAQGSGLANGTGLGSYPAVLLVTACGIGLSRSQSWDILHRLLSHQIERPRNSESGRVVDELFPSAWLGGDNKLWRNLEGFERHKTALSDHLCEVFADWGDSFLGLVPDFEFLYETWEIVGSLAYCERYSLNDIMAATSSPGIQQTVWMPIGRSGWHFQTRQQVFEYIKSDDIHQALVDAGFGKGDPVFLNHAMSCFERVASPMLYH